MSYRQVTRGTDFIILVVASSPPYLPPPFMALSLHEGHSVQKEASCFISPSWNPVSHLSIFGDSSSFVLLDCARYIFHILYLEPHLSCWVWTYTQPSFVGGLPFPFLYKETSPCKRGFRDEECRCVPWCTRCLWGCF